MNIIQAFQSGRDFRLKSGPWFNKYSQEADGLYFFHTEGDRFKLDIFSIMSDDWEVKPPPEPREWRIRIHSNGECCLYDSKALCRSEVKEGELVTVREVFS